MLLVIAKVIHPNINAYHSHLQSPLCNAYKHFTIELNYIFLPHRRIYMTVRTSLELYNYLLYIFPGVFNLNVHISS